MTNLKARLAKAKSRLFGTAAREIPVPFELPCDCGHRVTGIRRASYQTAVCSACESIVYVLPVNVYPANRHVRSEVIDGPVLSRVGTVMRDLVLGDPVAGDVTTAEKKSDRATARSAAGATTRESSATSETENRGEERRPGQKGRKSDATRSDQSSAAVETRGAAVSHDEPVVVLPRVSASVRLKRLFTTTRLLALAVIVLLMATGWWTIRQRTMDQARKVWRTEMDRVEDALKRRDLSTLGEALSRAVQASRTLNRNDAESQDAESLLRQTEAVQSVSATDLVTLFSGMVDEKNSFRAEAAESAATGLAGQRMVFEAALRESPTNQSGTVLDFPLIVDNISVEVRVDSTLLRKCAERMPATALLFVATIEHCQPPSQLDRIWQISLATESCTLITTELHAAELGYDLKATPAVAQTIQQQAEFVKTYTPTPGDELVRSKRTVQK